MNDPNVIDQTVSWKEKENVELENDQPIHLRFVLKNTDLFSFKFIETVQE
jgi:predicted pyridoxine 5'-phosphate oxidase superfamily flavin-nucleotide-binding protein